MIILIIFKAGILTIAGDVELNTGFYKILESGLRSFDQGNKTMFGVTAGCLCTCNAIFENICSHIRKLTCWAPSFISNLDQIFIKGGKIRFP